MSKETLEWLHENTLIGYRDELGAAWHGDGDNHFAAEVPIERVERLFGWEAESRPVFMDCGVEDGLQEIKGKRAIVHPDTNQTFAIVSDRYEIHQYQEWLVEQVSALLDVSSGELGIGSAGLLRGGGQAWVQVRPPATVEIGGEEHLPWVLATTSLDASLATQYKGQRQRVVCDNTLAVGLREGQAEFRVQHVKGTQMRLAEAREALEMLFTAQGEFEHEMEMLMNNTVTVDQFTDVVFDMMPSPEPVMKAGKQTNTRAINRVASDRQTISMLWNDDPRVAPWRGTEWGVLQAFNTWFTWERSGLDKEQAKARALRNGVDGTTAAFDRKVKGVLEGVMA